VGRKFSQVKSAHCHLASIALLVTIGIALSSVILIAHQASPPASSVPPPRQTGSYPTEATATVKSIKLVKSSTGIGAGLGEDTIGDKTFSVIKLRIHKAKALTTQGTPLRQDEAVEAISREPIDKDLVGKKVTALLEMRGDSARQRWLVTEIHLASSDTLKKD
jgi:hypothetical protein